MEINFDILKDITILLNNHLNGCMRFINSFSTKVGNRIVDAYIEPYNIILAASDIYYREKYHSYIIYYILKNRSKTLKYFINYINSQKNILNIDINNYLNAEIKCEENNIDILIKDLVSKHCIIVENKINNARDMDRQLPRYYDEVKKQGLTVDGILYFSLDGLKTPDTESWSSKELEIKKLIVYGAASNNPKNDFINNFLLPCKKESESEQEFSFYCQFIDLLKHLRRKHMDYELMKKFYNEMLNTEQFSSALSIREMLNDLIEFRRDRIFNDFLYNHKPFEKPPARYSSPCLLIDFETIREINPKERIKISVLCKEKETTVQFWIQDPEIGHDLIQTILVKIGEEGEFIKEKQNDYKKIFKFPDEDAAMYKYLKKIFSLLDKYKSDISV